MKIVFMGTPDIAVPSLTGLLERGHEVGMVVTKPDAARDRGRKVKFSPVKEKALESGIPVLQPERVKGNAEFAAGLSKYAPDMIIVVAYGQILPKDVLEIPRLGCINVHASLLPRHRGAAPIQSAILSGDEKTGVTIMYMEEKLDAGDMLAKAETEVDSKNAEELHDELALMGADLLLDTIEKVAAGEAEPVRQDDSLATYAPMIYKKDGHIDFNMDPEAIERKIRAFDPWPGAFCDYRGKMLKIWKAHVIDKPCDQPAGTVVSADDDGIVISCGGRLLAADVIQMPGKRRMKAGDYLRGNNIDKYELLR
ncbi:MAG: methionyl-tRNA formyltransferase [Anaerovoracaceae bacterium]|jgi:methionyl-tRNA formyltransferase